MATTKLTLEDAIAAGYRIVSRRYLTAARVDREDFMDVMQGGSAYWSKVSGARSQYRRVYSKDTITIPRDWIGKMRNSDDCE